MDFIEVFPNAISHTLCDRLITIFNAHPSVAAGQTGHGVDRSKKFSFDLTLEHHGELASIRDELLTGVFPCVCQYFDKYSMALMGAVSVQVADLSGQVLTLSNENYGTLGANRLDSLVKYLYRSGNINIQKYPQGQGGYPHWHSEQYPQLEQSEALHRVALFMVYLNDVAEGGETEFYYQQRQVRPSKGTVVIAPAGFTHTHRGNVPISNDKYIATSWIMFNRAEQLYRS